MLNGAKSSQDLPSASAKDTTDVDPKSELIQYTVCSVLTAIGQTIALAHGNNPKKLEGSNRFIPQLQQVLDGYRKKTQCC